MLEQCSRFQMACLGSGGVGKTSFIKQYLYEAHSEDHNETVEETYIQTYNINGDNKRIDFIDTAGAFVFPEMQKIYIARAVGFILVYSINDAMSFELVKIVWKQIKSMRKDILSIPCVIVGNKVDMENKREVETFDALEWAYNENLGGCFVEVSAKDNNGIKNAFDILLEQLGNTRSEQTGPFRMRTTSFTRHQSAADITRKILQRNVKMKANYDMVSPSSKCFQNLVFDNYKEKKIYRLITPHRKHALCHDKQQQKHFYRSRSDTWAHIVKRQRNSCVKVVRSNSMSVENPCCMEKTKVASSIRNTNLLDCQDQQSLQPDDQCHDKQSSTKTSLFMVKCVLQLCRKLRGKTIK
ncbi:ras-like protein RAS2 [Mytilus trossulus]|uniref:ras-like protein RAS2 n=1 Tax=Mytilus trossulus TaxID=6551 RepID=UPI003005B9AD